MKKNIRLNIIIFIFLLSFIYSSLFYKVNAENENTVSTEEILKGQSDSVGISSFIEEANKYKNEDFDIDVSKLISEAIKGNIDNKKIGNKIGGILFSQLGEAVTSIGIIIVIIIISSVLKSISDDLENKGIAQISHYVTYILIVTIIMKNFSDIIMLVKSSIENLIGFSNSLIPLLITLMITTRKHSICRNATTHYIINYNFYRKFYKYNFNSSKFNICGTRYNF